MASCPTFRSTYCSTNLGKLRLKAKTKTSRVFGAKGAGNKGSAMGGGFLPMNGKGVDGICKYVVCITFWFQSTG